MSREVKRSWLFVLLPLCLFPWTAFASSTRPVQETLTSASITGRMMLLAIQLGVILFAAKLGSIVLEKIHLPGPLGELMAGILIGPYMLGGVPFRAFPDGLFPLHGGFPISPELYGLCAVAAVVLLFRVGLETDIKLLLRYSLAGGLVGLGGVAVSFLLGAAVVTVLSGPALGEPSSFFAPRSLLLAVVLSATSVGVTARILSERGKMDSPEGVTILSAAVIDDVIGIVLLAVVMGVVSASKATGSIDWGHIGVIAAKAVGVWLAATAIGLAASRKLSVILKWFGDRTSVAVMALGLALVLAGLFEEAGLAMIIGAYVMGLSLSKSDISRVVQEKLHPIYAFLIPVFFCVMGMQINVTALTSPGVLLFGLAYAGVALASKVVGCGLPALLANFNLRGALRVGFGMAPRCEVALIIAGIGLSTRLLPPELFAAVIVMVVVNTLVAPAALVCLYRKPVSGTRKVISGQDANRETVVFEFPSVEMTEFLVSKLSAVFESEGFFVHLVSHQKELYQLRKDAAVIDFRRNAAYLTFDCDQADIPLVNTAMYEAIAELERAIRGLKEPLDSGSIATRVQQGAPRRPQMLDLRQYLTPALVEPELRGTTKAAVIDELLGMLVRNSLVTDAAAARRAIWRREESMSTGLQHGVAIPHGKTDAVGHLVCTVGISRAGVDFDSMDGEPSRIFVLTLSPESKPAPHVQFMSTISQLLNASGRERILSCTTAGELYRAITAKAEIAPAATPMKFRLSDYLHPDVLQPNLRGSSKEQVIDELLQLLAAAGRLEDVDSAREAILARERQMSTGMQDGIAIPHGRTDTVEGLVCAVGVKREGLDFGSVDGKPTQIVVMALTPPRGGDPYLQFAAAIIGALDAPGRQRVLAANTGQQLYAALTGATQA